MEMHQVRYFLALCEYGSFTRAAKRCSVAQPSLSKAIKELERELGSALFFRAQAGTLLTPLGKRLRRHFVRIAESAAAIELQAANLKSTFQPIRRKEIAMPKSLLLSAVVLLAFIAIGGALGTTSMLTGASRPQAASVTTLDPHTLHLSIKVSALPETRINEPF